MPLQSAQFQKDLDSAREQALSIQESIRNLPSSSQEPQPSTPQTQERPTNVFLQEAQKRMIDDRGMVSSTDTGLQERVQQATSQIGASRQSGEELIASRFGREIERTERAGVEGATVQRERTGGFATNMAALREITRETDNRISDLERNREEAFLSNNVAAANRMTELITREMQMDQQARQQAINNLMSMAQMEQQTQQFEAQRDFQERQFGFQQQKFGIQTDMQQEQMETQRAAERINFLAQNNLIQDTPDEQLSELERQYGIPEGILSKIKNLPELNLRQVSGVGLVNVVQREDGSLDTQLLVAEPQKAQERKRQAGEPIIAFGTDRWGRDIQYDLSNVTQLRNYMIEEDKDPAEMHLFFRDNNVDNSTSEALLAGAGFFLGPTIDDTASLVDERVQPHELQDYADRRRMSTEEARQTLINDVQTKVMLGTNARAAIREVLE